MTQATLPDERVAPLPLRPELFMPDARTGEPRLRGSRCAHCGRVYFPRRVLCAACFDEGAMIDHPLDRYAVVHASTTVRVASAVGHTPPYACGYVDLPAERIRIFAPFSGDRPESFTPGRKLEIAIAPVRIRALGEVLAYSFVPRAGD